MIKTDLETLIIIYLFALVICYSKMLNIEGFDNNEALQNIASMYNSGTMTVQNLKVTGNADITGSTLIGGNTSIGGNASIGGNTNVSGISTLGKFIIKDSTISAQNSLDMIFNTDKSIKVCDVGTDTLSSGSFQIGNIVSQNSLRVGNASVIEQDFSRLTKKNINMAGLFGVRGYSSRVPLYFGWNMLWSDKNTTTFAKNLIARYGSGLTAGNLSYCGLEMTQSDNKDTNWHPAYLALLPGYVAKFFYWDFVSTTNDIYTEGQYYWDAGKAPRAGRVFAIYINYIENRATIPETGKTFKDMVS